MTTLNTIIEEEKKEFDEQFGGLLEGSDPLDIHKSNLKAFLTTAMQRAYEAGRQNTVEDIERRLPDELRTMSDGKVYRGVVSLEEVKSILKDITKEV